MTYTSVQEWVYFGIFVSAYCNFNKLYCCLMLNINSRIQFSSIGRELCMAEYHMLSNTLEATGLFITSFTLQVCVLFYLQEVTIVVPSHWREARCRVQLAEPNPGVAYQVWHPLQLHQHPHHHYKQI